MNFFEHQENAHRSSRWLIFLFILATLAVVFSLDIIISSVYLLNSDKASASFSDIPLSVHLWSSGLIATTIIIMTVYRLLDLRAGGYKVAEDLGGRRLSNNQTLTTEEQRLLNIVEEMAIASGTETPSVYILEDSAINAFAAGLNTRDAVIGITRGALDLLNREEMQGVIAHEFSHILHGDMRLNLQMIGVLFGLTFISNIGSHLTYAGARSRDSAPIVIIGLGITLIGFIGIFFASMIKAAISRQREFLADASAVKYTRNNFGIANALKKIGGWSIGSHLSATRAVDYSHFYIADGVSAFARGFFETHPPLKQRIARLEPNWDGEFPFVKRSPEQIQSHHKRKELHKTEKFSTNSLPDITVASLTAAIALTGMPNMHHVEYAHNMLADIPLDIIDATNKPLEAYTLILLLILHDDIDNWPKRFANINADMNNVISPLAVNLSAQVKALNVKYRLPLLEMCIPALKELLPDQQNILKKDVIAVIRSDNKIKLWEWALYRIIRLSLSKPIRSKIKYNKLTSIQSECELVLASICISGSNDTKDRQEAFLKAASSLGFSSKLPEKQALSTKALKDALDKIAQLKPLLKPRVLKALAIAAESDGIVCVEEVELIRAFAESIDCPMPPLIAD